MSSFFTFWLILLISVFLTLTSGYEFAGRDDLFTDTKQVWNKLRLGVSRNDGFTEGFQLSASSKDTSTPSDDRSFSEEISARYGAGEKARKLRELIPRFGPTRYDEGEEVGYVKGLAYLAVPPAALGVLCGFGCVLFCLLRCCGCCCAKHKPEGYTAKERRPYVIAAVVLSLLTTSFACVGWWANEELSRGATGKNDGIGNLFLALFDDAIDLTDRVNHTMFSIADMVPGIADDVSLLLGDASDIAQGTINLVNQLASVATTYQDFSVTTPGYGPIEPQTFNCTLCASISSDVNNVASDVQADSDEIFQMLNDTRNTIDETLVEARQQIVDGLNEASDQILKVKEEVQPHVDQVRRFKDEAEKYDSWRRIAVHVLFALPVMSFVLLIIAVVTKGGGFLIVAYSLGGFIMFIFFLLLAVHLPLALVTGDSCLILDEYEANLTAKGLDPKAVDVINSCLLDLSLLDALNVTNDLDFARAINFPEVPHVNESFQWAELETYKLNVSSMTAENFGFEDQEDFILEQLNNLTTPDYFEISNISLCVPANYPPQQRIDAVDTLLAAIEINADARTKINQAVDDIVGNFTMIFDYAEALKASAASFQERLNNAEQLVQPLLDRGQEALDLATCVFVGNYYKKVKSSFCDTIASGLTFLSLAFTIIAFATIPLSILQVSLSKQLNYPAERGPFDFKGEEIEMPATVYVGEAPLAPEPLDEPINMEELPPYHEPPRHPHAVDTLDQPGRHLRYL